VKIRYDLEIPDLVAFAQYHARHSPAVRRVRLLTLAIVLAPVVVLPPLLVPADYRWLALAGGIVTAGLVALRMPRAYNRAVECRVWRQ
jgi:hypothetical protein